MRPSASRPSEGGNVTLNLYRASEKGVGGIKGLVTASVTPRNAAHSWLIGDGAFTVVSALVYIRHARRA